MTKILKALALAILLPAKATSAFAVVVAGGAVSGKGPRHGGGYRAWQLLMASSSSSSASSSSTTRRPDATAAIQAALEASRAHGPTSPEARVAWGAVEEMDASDNSAAYQAGSDAECTVDDDTSRACQEYQAKLQELQRLLVEIPKVQKIKTLALELQAIKLRDPAAAGGGGGAAADSPELRSALDRARSVSAAEGPSSAEARLAWAEVEEIASAGLENAMGDRLDEECLVESAETACIALEELSRAVNLQRVQEQGLADF